MARIRTIKPEFFTSLTIASLALEARLTFIGLWTHCDDDGRCVDDTRLIRAALWPLDDRSFANVEKDLMALADASLIVRYEVSGRRYLAVSGWREHQKINRPSKSKLPAPPNRPGPPVSREDATSEPSGESSLSIHGDLTEDSLGERKGKEGKGTTGTGPYSSLGRNARDFDEPPPSDEAPSIVESLLNEYRDHSPNGIPDKVAKALAAEMHQLLRNNFQPDHIREALWQLRPRRLGAGALPSLVDEIANAPMPDNVVALRGTSQQQPYVATSDRKIAQVDAAVASLKAQMQNGAAQ